MRKRSARNVRFLVAERDRPAHQELATLLDGPAPRVYDRLDVLEIQRDVLTVSVNYQRPYRKLRVREGAFPQGCVLVVIPLEDPDTT